MGTFTDSTPGVPDDPIPSNGTRDYRRFDELAEEFAERCRRREQPSLQEFVDRLPQMAREIRELFPALVEVEKAERDARVDAMDQQAAVPHLGELGDYRIVREIGRGGMGVVYEAEQVSLGRRVALKVLPAGVLADSRQVRRFEREARSAARLHHTHIVPVFGVGEHEGTHFYVMQLIEGQGLDAVLRELRGLRVAVPAPPQVIPYAPRDDRSPSAAEIATSLATSTFNGGSGERETFSQPATVPWFAPTEEAPLEPRSPRSRSVSGSSSLSAARNRSTLPETGRLFFQAVARIGVQVAEALAHAHSQGILHRDIKPSNLLLDRAGNVWVADFGLAKAVDSEDLTHTGDAVGTLRYMAPERFQGEGDARADTYALGLTLYELLALRPAFPEPDRTKLVRQVIQEDPPGLRKLNRHVPPDLATIVHKAMAREPGQRYATAAALAEDLKRFIDGRPIEARKVTAVERAWRWCRRNRTVAALVGVIALALVLGTVVSSYFALRATRGERLALQKAEEAQQNARLATQATEHANQETQRARTAELESEERLYLAEINLAQQAWQDGRMDLLQQAIRALEPKRPEDPDRRGFEWYYLERLCHLDLRTFQSASRVAFSPDGSRLASAGTDHTVKVWNSATGKELLSLDGHSKPVNRLAFSPDGRRLASASNDHTVKLWDPASGQEALTLRGHSGDVLSVAFSPDGRWIASAGGDWTRGDESGELNIWEAATGRLKHAIAPRKTSSCAWRSALIAADSPPQVGTAR